VTREEQVQRAAELLLAHPGDFTVMLYGERSEYVYEMDEVAWENGRPREFHFRTWNELIRHARRRAGLAA
jgi:hypothetical protein